MDSERGQEANRRHGPTAAGTPRVSSTGFTRRWRRGSRERFGEPTLAQRLGWPAIASGQNCLIVAPTGSGKTLAAFLAALDHLWTNPRPKPGVRILYISPLKALNQDIWKNLQVPLEEIQARSRDMGNPLPVLRVAVRSGDTPSHERAAMVRKPPDILITTPESLHLMLTSRAQGDPARGLARDCRRDPRGLPEQAGRVSGALARAARSHQSAELRPDRAFGDAEAARGSCAVSGRNLASWRCRPRGRGRAFARSRSSMRAGGATSIWR